MKQLLRRVRRRFLHTHAPRVAVRVALPWYIRWSGVAALCAAAAAIAWWAPHPQHQAPPSVAPELVAEPVAPTPAPADLAAARERIEELERQASELRTQLAAAQRQSTIDRAAQGELTKSLGKAQEEAARMREELALYQSSLQTSAASGGVQVQNFKVERDAVANRYRYRLLLTHKSQRAQDFKGQGLMNVSFERDGKPASMTLKQGVAGTSVVELRFKYYQQIEGTFQVDEGAVIKKVEFVVFEEGKDVPMLTSAAALSLS